MAWTRALPRRMRAERLAAVAAAPALSLALVSVALVSLSRVGVPLTALSVRLTLLALAGIGLALPGVEPPRRAPGWAAGALAVVLAAGAALAFRVLHGFPVPGNDWAKYVLYADEIRRQHHMLITNPFWMLGVPFREDPGAPSVYGAFLLLSRAPAVTLAHGAYLLALAGVASTYTWVRSFASPAAGVAAAAVVALVPAGQDILGWQGVANLAGLAVMPLVLGLALPLAYERLTPAEAAGAALLVTALAAAHRLTLAVTAAAVGLTVLALLPRRWRTLTPNAGRVLAALVVLGLCVALDIRARQQTFGGALPYTDYLGTKLSLGRLAKDLTYPVCAAAVLALGVVAARRREAGLLPAVFLLLVSAVLTYAWVFHLPLAYLRMAYYVPLALAPLIAVAAVGVRPGRLAAGATAALLVAVAVLSWQQGPKVRRFYTFADAPALRGMDDLAARLRPGEVVVTDRCWSFLATWLLHTRTLPALDTADIQPAAELPVAREAHAVFDDTIRGRSIARRLGVRYALASPVCASPSGRGLEPPRAATAIYASDHLVVFRLRR
jgi:hypothetical protein